MSEGKSTFEIIAELFQRLISKNDFSRRYELLASKKKKIEENIEEALTLYHSIKSGKFGSKLDLTRVVNLPGTCTSIKRKLAKIQAYWNDLDQGLNYVQSIESFKPWLIGAATLIFPDRSANFYEQLISTFANIGEIIMKGAKLIGISRELDAEKAKLQKCQKVVLKQLEKKGSKVPRNIVHAWKAITSKKYLDDFMEKTKHPFKTSTVAKLSKSSPEAKELHYRLALDIHKRLCKGEEIEMIVSIYKQADPIKGIRVRLTKKFVRELRDLNKIDVASSSN